MCVVSARVRSTSVYVHANMCECMQCVNSYLWKSDSPRGILSQTSSDDAGRNYDPGLTSEKENSMIIYPEGTAFCFNKSK